MSINMPALLDKIEGKNSYYVFVAMLLIISLLDYFLLMSPQLGALRKISPEIKILAEDLDKAKSNMNKVDSYRTELERLTQNLDSANVKIKSRNEVPVVLERIASLASETGVKIDQIMPDTLAQELITENNQRKYFALPIYMEARSGYHDFGKFLNKMEQDDISLKIGSFTIVATSDNRYHAVKLTFQATLYEEIGE